MEQAQDLEHPFSISPELPWDLKFVALTSATDPAAAVRERGLGRWQPRTQEGATATEIEICPDTDSSCARHAAPAALGARRGH